MGLDWCTIVKCEGSSPCSLVDAPKFKDRQNLEDSIAKRLDEKREIVKQIIKDMHCQPHEKEYANYWLNRTVEEIVEEVADTYDCDNCPLLKDLAGADSSRNAFLGTTVCICDFRGKKIVANKDLDENLRNEAYEDRNPDEMLDYADRLEKDLERLRGIDAFATSYEEYVEEWHHNSYPFKDPMLSEDEYKNRPSWREKDFIDAIHWLRTCAKYGISMHASY